MLKVEFIYDGDCPNFRQARANLQSAFEKLGVRSGWIEWDRSSSKCPKVAKKYGSPTILVNGEDIAGIELSSEVNSCRVYRNEDGKLNGIPSVDLIIKFLSKALASDELKSKNLSGTFFGSFAAGPSVLFSIIPSAVCPACLPAYLSFLSGVGVGVFITTKTLFILTLIFLILAISFMGFHAFKRKNYVQFLIGFSAAAMIMLGKFVLLSNVLLYGGVLLLIGSSLWDSILYRRVLKTKICPMRVEKVLKGGA